MDEANAKRFEELKSGPKDARYQAFLELKEAVSSPVDWSYEIWDDLLMWLKAGDNHQRAIAAQLLAGLAQSDPERRMVRDIDAIFAVTRDERFVTARHALQSFWRIGLISPELRAAVIERLTGRFVDCAPEKNCTLIRYDIMVSLAELSRATGDESVRTKAAELVELETDLKYKKKYSGALKQLLRAQK